MFSVELCGACTLARTLAKLSNRIYKSDRKRVHACVGVRARVAGWPSTPFVSARARALLCVVRRLALSRARARVRRQTSFGYTRARAHAARNCVLFIHRTWQVYMGVRRTGRFRAGVRPMVGRTDYARCCTVIALQRRPRVVRCCAAHCTRQCACAYVCVCVHIWNNVYSRKSVK